MAKITRNDAAGLWNNYDALASTIPALKPNANCTWFTLAELKDYIADIEKSVPNGKTLSGFRIYLGKYGPLPADATKANKLTLFISPTGHDITQASAAENDADLDMAVLNFGNQGHPPYVLFPKI
jgi:hypothetical protein